MNLALLLMLPMLLAPALNSELTLMVDPDIWWHLANARILVTTHHFIHIEPYSFTVAGQPWINPEWLSELPYWFGMHGLGLRGIYLITWLVLGANILFVYWRGYKLSRHAGAAFWAAGIGFLLMLVNSGPRTIAIAYLALSAELGILEAAERGKTRLLWLLPPLFCLWINLHGSWLIGMALFVLYLVCGLFTLRAGVFHQQAFTRQNLIRLLTVLAASIAALIVNPYGWRLIWNPIDMMLNQRMNIATVAEWQPLHITSLAGTAMVVSIGLMLVANGLRSRQWKIYELAMVVFAWYAAIDHMRFAFLAAVITTPLLASSLERGIITESDSRTIPAMNALMVAAAVAVIFLMFPAEAALSQRQASLFPMKIIAAMQPSWRTYNWDFLGGMMAFQSKPDFIDSRFDTFEHHGVMQDYLRIMQVDRPLPLLEGYGIDHVLVRDVQPLASLLQTMPGWHLEMKEKAWEGSYVLYAREPASSRASAPSDHSAGPMSAPAQ